MAHEITLQITLPVPVERIPAELERINAEIRTTEANLKALRSLVQAVRSFCPHTSQDSDNDPRGSTTWCKHCGQTW